MKNIVSKELNGTRSLMKFIETKDHSWFAKGSGCNSLHGRCHGFFLLNVGATRKYC